MRLSATDPKFAGTLSVGHKLGGDFYVVGDWKIAAQTMQKRWKNDDAEADGNLPLPKGPKGWTNPYRTMRSFLPQRR